MDTDYTKTLSKIMNALPASSDFSGVVLKNLFKDVSDEFYFWALTEGYKLNSTLRELLPIMPDEQIQENFTGRSGTVALTEAFSAYKLFKQLAKQFSREVDQCEKILDFGCGWGRIIRFFLKDLEPSGLYGVDCYKDMIDICHESNLRCNFEAIDPMPPARFHENMFDIIYLYSVFSHLSEDAHLKWLSEFSRILKPGGILIATTRPRYFITYCARLRNSKHTKAYQYGAAASFPDTDQSLMDYDNGKYSHSATGSVGVLETSFYGETCIPKKYVEDKWKDFFSRVDFLYQEDHGSFDQNVIVAIKDTEPTYSPLS